MKSSYLIIGLMLAMVLTATYAFAQGCGMPGMGAGGCGMMQHDPAAVPGQPAAENLITLTGTVVAVQANGAALVDTGEARTIVVTCPPAEGEAPVAAFKVGDRIQVSGVLMALSVQPAQEEQTAAADVQTATFKVENILCGMCSASVQEALQRAPGVAQASVTAAGVAKVQYDPAVTNTTALARAIVGARHPHAPMKFKATLQ